MEIETRLSKLKSEFNNIITIRNSVKDVFDILQVRIDKLRQIYTEFIDSNKHEMFVFGLDSFQFQSKLIDIEYDDMKRLFLVINNRMYCEYFKLHKIVVDYISTTLTYKQGIDLVKINQYPTYKDLEPFKEYKFEITLDIHENIVNLLGVIATILNNKENELSIHKTKQSSGLNIDNFITTFNFNLSVLREKVLMFITYIEFFHKMHSKYLKRFSNKIQLMYTHINHDIKFDDTIEVSKDKKKELVDEVFHGADKQLMTELKQSIGSETNSECGSPVTMDDLHFEGSEHEKVEGEGEKSDDGEKGEEGEKPPSSNARFLFRKNVFKVFQLNKEKEKEHGLSNSDIQRIFSGIDQTCDSIIDGEEPSL